MHQNYRSYARKLYPTELTAQQWHIFKPLISTSKAGGRSPTVNMREVVNTIFYILAGSCAWRLLPYDLPPWSTVYYSMLVHCRSLAADKPKLRTKGTLLSGERQLQMLQLWIASQLKLPR